MDIVIDRSPSQRLLARAQRDHAASMSASDPRSNAATAAKSDPWIGHQTQNLRFDALIGRGGMGSVYRGEQVHLGRPVAIKVVSAHLADDDRYLERFTREARLIAAIAHPRIVACYDFGPFADPKGEPRRLLVLEHVAGPSLATWLEQPRPLAELMTVLDDVCAALAAAHARGIIHRDVKPENVLLDADGRGKLGDFGLARIAVESTSVTVAGELVGSPAYMSPEACHGQEPTARSDIYSLGCMLFAALAGRPPFPAATALAAIDAHLHRAPPTVSSHRPELAAADGLIARCLAKDPAQRPSSVEQVATELRALARRLDPTLLAGGPATSDPTVLETGLTSVRPRRRTHLAVVAAVLAAVGLIAVGVASAMLRGNPPVATGAPERAVTTPPAAVQRPLPVPESALPPPAGS
jgi:serine/threonine-protein kinase